MRQRDSKGQDRTQMERDRVIKTASEIEKQNMQAHQPRGEAAPKMTE